MENEPSDRKTAIVFIGNAGAGKSTLLSQIGGNFESGAVFRRGFTTDITETEVTLGSERVVLIDIPGLFEPNPLNTQRNAIKLTEALTKDYDYKLFFVLKANNSGLEDAEIEMMAKVDECVRKFDGSPVIFRVFINQILEQRVYDMYQEQVADDYFQKVFSSQRDTGFTTNISIDRVTLLWFDEDSIREKSLANCITEDVLTHSAIQLSPQITFNFASRNQDAREESSSINRNPGVLSFVTCGNFARIARILLFLCSVFPRFLYRLWFRITSGVGNSASRNSATSGRPQSEHQESYSNGRAPRQISKLS